jgi:hypothetical protein
MAVNDDPFEPPLYRHRKALEAMIEVHKAAVIQLHLEASRLSGHAAKELRDIADDMDDYAEYLKERLQHRRFRGLLP